MIYQPFTHSLRRCPLQVVLVILFASRIASAQIPYFDEGDEKYYRFDSAQPLGVNGKSSRLTQTLNRDQINFVYFGTFDLLVPGTKHPRIPHVTVWTDGKWGAEIGYLAQLDNPTKVSVRWMAGVPHSCFAHLHSGVLEGQWVLEPGYRPDPNTKQPKWTPGIAELGCPQAVSGIKEGDWNLKPGYELHLTKTSIMASWHPGKSYPETGLVAGEIQDTWKPIDGYEFISKDSSDLRVVKSPPKFAGTQSPVTVDSRSFNTIANTEGTTKISAGDIVPGTTNRNSSYNDYGLVALCVTIAMLPVIFAFRNMLLNSSKSRQQKPVRFVEDPMWDQIIP